MKLLTLIFTFMASMVCLNSCNYSVTMAHTEGTATDVIDETASNTPSTTVSVPATGL
jgi:hypothetical protein